MRLALINHLISRSGNYFSIHYHFSVDCALASLTKNSVLTKIFNGFLQVSCSENCHAMVVAIPRVCLLLQ